MKKIAFLLCSIMIMGLYSCKKCSTCTNNDAVRGTLTNEEVCGKGKRYDSILETYKKNGWSCVKK